MQIKNCLYINNQDSDLIELPNFIKKKIFNELQDNKKVIILTDYVHSNLKYKMFGTYIKEITKNINYKNLILEMCDCDESSLKYPLEFIKNEYANSNDLFIIWNIENVKKYQEDLIYYIDQIQKSITTYKNKNIENMIYIQNKKYNFEFFYSLCDIFQEIIVYNNNKDLIFHDKKEFYKLIDFICSYEQLRDKNKKLLSFNKSMDDIPISLNANDFKQNIINKLMSVCNLKFCCIYEKGKTYENSRHTHKCYGLNENKKYYLFNDSIITKFYKDISKYVISTGNSLKLNVNSIENKYVRYKFIQMNIKSIIGIGVYYNKENTGVIWVAPYADNDYSIDKDIKYIESMCKRAFCTIQDQKNFFHIKNKVIQNQKLKTMEEMAAGIAHDINNILTPIIGSVEILKHKYCEDNLIQKQLKIVEMCAYDATNIINKLKKITKNCNDNNVDIFNVNEIIVDAVSLTENKWLNQSLLKGVKINISTELNSKEKIQGNITEIREVIINIISNAVDAIKYCGSIDILTKDYEDNVIIEIKDNGVGINEKIENKIFQPFFTTKGKKGSGLGLSIAYEIIHSIGGTINCQSSKENGTKFIIKIPISNISKSKYNKKIKKYFYNVSKNILIIDDHVEVSNILCELIKSITNCRIKSINPRNIESIEEELKMRNYDIVICDFSMPNVNGVQISKSVKEINKNTYFCLMTGWIGTLKEISMECVDEVLNKPLTKEIIQDFFNRYEKKVY